MHKVPTYNAFDTVELPVSNVQAIQTTRISPTLLPQSASPFDGFNLGLHVGDNPEQVIANRQALFDFLPAAENIQWLEQVHGNDVAVISSYQPTPIIADAVITQTPKLALAIMTADCLPILLASKDGQEIAAIHGGWRSLAANIIENTLNKMHCDNSHVYAWLGPCIGPKVFEVGDEVKQAFVTQSQDFNGCFTKSMNDKWLADLAKIAYIMLQKQHVANISTNSPCTYSENQRYYSYRKTNITGRMAAIVYKE